MFDDLHEAVSGLSATIRSELAALVAIPSVSAPGFDPAHVGSAAAAASDLLRQAGFAVQLLEAGDGPPAVFGEITGPPGAKTVLLYAHYDVQPPGPTELWNTDPFTPVELDGRLFGRGSSDDKCGILIHTGAIRALGNPPVTVKVILEGEEEVGSPNLPDLIQAHQATLAADVIVIADSGNLHKGAPTLTTSLRGLVDCTVEVRTIEAGVHSGQYGGVVPDALTTLARLLATLHDDQGNVAIAGLHEASPGSAELDEDAIRAEAGMLPGVETLGAGSVSHRLWTKPAVAVLAIDATPVSEAINQLVPSARAKVSLRLAPGDNPQRAMAALRAHLENNAPWGASVSVEEGAMGEAFELVGEGPAFEAFATGMAEAWGTAAITSGQGGSIPFVAAFTAAYPEAAIILTGAGDEQSRAHGPNESVDLGELERSVLAEAIALRLLGS